ncbi:hypothetical protein BDZ90DRAFT_37395 [Jaminaea rosea]|uniref:Uncharacterized protein n=1 Tax=Jaminaea rosea TaxID=1569628 RepID=A0A316V4L7_9BASI|nr:hypothetical protein BDZ90DRAFT_37395 [Jaminaea rosea]PWN31173.1 hypothetical protein BDZ90DRAFT_37395 [Jaminaea rosea]
MLRSDTSLAHRLLSRACLPAASITASCAQCLLATSIVTSRRHRMHISRINCAQAHRRRDSASTPHRRTTSIAQHRCQSRAVRPATTAVYQRAAAPPHARGLRLRRGSTPALSIHASAQHPRQQRASTPAASIGGSTRHQRQQAASTPSPSIHASTQHHRLCSASTPLPSAVASPAHRRLRSASTPPTSINPSTEHPHQLPGMVARARHPRHHPAYNPAAPHHSLPPRMNASPADRPGNFEHP